MGNINKNKDNKQKKKLPFGRNLFTILFVLVCTFIIAFVIYTIQSYVTAANKSKYTPFVTQSITDGTASEFSEGTFNSVDSRIKHDKFDKLGVYLVCNKYIEDDSNATTRTAVYKVAVYENDNTPTIKNGTVSVSFCMAAPWVGFIKYPSSSAPKDLTVCESQEAAEASSNSYYKTFTISGQIDFPAKVNTFPIPITIDAPTLYLYISITDTYSKTTTYVLEYSYYDLLPLDGGIIK